MPVVARFCGIVIRMYFQQSEHNPPHVHAAYGNDAAVFDIRTGSLMDGTFPSRESVLVTEWVAQNRAALLDMWDTQKFRRLDS